MSDALLAEDWTLTCGGLTQSAAEIGVTDLVRRRVSQGADVCLVQVGASAVGTALVFAYGATVVIARNGVTWFVGRVTAVPASGDGDGEGQVYRLSGPWWFLEQLVARQSWSVRGGQGSVSTSRLILGQAADGSRLTTGGVIGQMLQDAVAAGAPLQAGVIDPALFAPLDEVRELTCAEVVQAMLRWHPDGVTWFDYTTTPLPTLHCRQRRNLPAATLTVGSAPLAAVRGITARHDLAVPAVVLHYEVSVAGSDGATLLDVVTDAAPAGATGQEFGALVGTIPLGAPGVAANAATAVGTAMGALLAAGAQEPAGGTMSLAAGVLAAWSALAYSGSVVLAEGPGALGGTGAGLGSVVNLAGSGPADWATMRALVVAEEVRVATGTTTLQFGPGSAGEGEGNGGGLSGALRVTRSGVTGREAGSQGLAGTAMSAVRVSGQVTPEL